MYSDVTHVAEHNLIRIAAFAVLKGYDKQRPQGDAESLFKHIYEAIVGGVNEGDKGGERE